MTHEEIDLLTAITGGVSDQTYPGKGLYAEDDNRGTLTVKLVVTYEDLSTEDIFSALKVI